MKKTFVLLLTAVFGLALLSSCKDDGAADEVTATVILRQSTEEEEPVSEVRARTLVLEVKGENIVSGWAGIFLSPEISEAEYENAIAGLPIDDSDIEAINSEKGWIRKFHDLRCTPPENDRDGFRTTYTVVVKLVNKAGVGKIFTATHETMLEPPPM